METTLNTPASAAAAHEAPAAPRFDGYHGIHKALRLFLCDTLTRVGATDPTDAAAVQAVLAQLDDLLALCESHVKHENTFVHPALEAAQPGSSARIAGEHVEHLQAIEHVRELGRVVAATAGLARASALGRLYSALALFVGENLVHMHAEETLHNPVMWAHYSDAELAALDGRIRAAIAPAEMERALAWFVPALNALERAGMFGAMRSAMPPEPFRNLMAMARTRLAEGEYAKLEAALSAAR
jgi:hypothetical protein